MISSVLALENQDENEQALRVINEEKYNSQEEKYILKMIHIRLSYLENPKNIVEKIK